VRKRLEWLGAGRKWGGSGALQFLILLFSELQPDSSAADFDAVFDGLARFEVEGAASALGEFEYFGVALEGELFGEGSLEVFLEKAAVPTLTDHVIHVNPV